MPSFRFWNGDVRSAGSEGRAGRASARCGEVARQQALAGLHVRITRARALRQPLLEAFVVSEHEQLVLLQGTSDGPSELMPFERALGGLEVVLGIQSAVPVILEDVPMPVVRSGRGHNADLPSGPFPILGPIGVLENVVFPYRLYPEQLGTGPGGRNELAGRVPSDPVDAVEQKPVSFLPMAGHRESGKSATGPSCHIRSVIDNAGVESQKLIEGSPIQRQFFDLRLPDQSRRRAQRGVYNRRCL